MADIGKLALVVSAGMDSSFTSTLAAAAQKASAFAESAQSKLSSVAAKAPNVAAAGKGDAAKPPAALAGVQSMLGQIGSLASKLPGGGLISGLTSQANGAVGSLSSMSGSLSSMATSAVAALGPVGLVAVGVAAVAIAAVGAAYGIYEWAKSAMAAISAQVKLAARLGVSIESLQRLQFAMTASGVSAEDAADGMNKMQIALGNLREQMRHGTGPALQAFQRLGLDAERFANMPLDQQVLALSSALAGVTNAADRAAIGQHILGRAGYAAFGPMLSRGREWIEQQGRIAEAMGAVMSAADARNVAASYGSLRMISAQLGALWTGMGNALAIALAPAIGWVSNLINGFIALAANSGILRMGVQAAGQAMAALAIIVGVVLVALMGPLVPVMTMLAALGAVLWGVWQVFKAGWDIVKAVVEVIMGLVSAGAALLGFGDSTLSMSDLVKGALEMMMNQFRAIQAVLTWFVQLSIESMMGLVAGVQVAIVAIQDLNRSMRGLLALAGPLGQLGSNFLGGNLNAANDRLAGLIARLRAMRNGTTAAAAGAASAAGDGLRVQVTAPEAMSINSKEAVAAINANLINAPRDGVQGAVEAGNAIAANSNAALNAIQGLLTGANGNTVSIGATGAT